VRNGKTFLIAVTLVAASVGFLFLPLRAWFVQLQGGVGSLGAIGPVVVAVAYVAMTVLPIPRLPPSIAPSAKQVSRWSCSPA
jgi:hypothetical protein